METTIVICTSLSDFSYWIFDNFGFMPKLRSRILMVGERRFIGVSEIHHLCGHRCNDVAWTQPGLANPNFSILLITANQYCLAHKKPFKFGR